MVHENGTLVVTSAGPEDTGVYKCVGAHPKRHHEQTYAAILTLACKYPTKLLTTTYTIIILSFPAQLYAVSMILINLNSFLKSFYTRRNNLCAILTFL